MDLNKTLAELHEEREPSRVEIYSLSNWYKLSVRSIHAMDVNEKLVAHTVEIEAATAAKQTAKH